ncbi:Tat pathway signal protein [Streptomyces sp. NPDC051784]|uniref:Tat pathway signal protein n=1 Tax=Streptomyces sp. NPDC051784 TaxID=3155805 RepID=UPI0034413AD2
MNLTKAIAVATAAATALTLGVCASPASAHTSDGWVRGYGDFSDDWNDEGVLSRSSYATSNATCLWQKILWAENARYPGSDTSEAFTKEQIDGVFGNITAMSTNGVQTRWNLGRDGTVGGATFGRAAKNLSYVSGSTAAGKGLALQYNGKGHTFSVMRDTEGKYRFLDRQGDWRQAGYGYRSCG